jgi:3-hydroxybutyryl-CoA dehydrogenase
VAVTTQVGADTNRQGNSSGDVTSTSGPPDPNLATERGPRAPQIIHVLVVGAGQMGAGIAQLLAAAGRSVSLFDTRPEATQRALERIRSSLERLATRDRPDVVSVLGRIQPVEQFVSADMMIEAIAEDVEAKRDVFRRAEGVLPVDSVLASNTSSVPISQLSSATQRPQRVVGMHFFNPVPLMGLVEIVRAAETSDETIVTATGLATDLGKTPVVVGDLPGFASNRVLMPFINEAAWALSDGVATAEDIDLVATLGFNHPMGPLALADLIGLDTCVAVMRILRDGLRSPRFAPCPLLVEHVAAGRLGRKTGQGFYSYGSGGIRPQ